MQLGMPCFVDVHGRPTPFLNTVPGKDGRGRREVGLRKRGGREYYSQDAK